MNEWLWASLASTLMIIVSYFLRELHKEFHQWKRELIELKTGLRALEVELRSIYGWIKNH